MSAAESDAIFGRRWNCISVGQATSILPAKKMRRVTFRGREWDGMEWPDGDLGEVLLIAKAIIGAMASLGAADKGCILPYLMHA